jgi:MYXO-CTERM domain-containing protein
MPPPLALLALAGLVTPSDPAAVAHGNAAMPCQWPTVASFRTSDEKCTATLVHPRVVVTAAHCLEASTPGRIRFGEQYQPAAFMAEVERCGLDPDYPRTHAPSSDVGYCVLVEPVEGIPPTPLLMGCELEWLHEGMPAVIVGFGQTETDEEFGTKRYAFTTLASELRDDGTIMVGDAEVNGCLGDSGGPAFVQSPAGTWHALGVLVYGPECAQGPVLYRVLADRLAWLEAETAFDLSPCHDAEGGWEPGPACGPIARDPLTTATSWAELCASALTDAPACPAPASTTDTASSTDDTGPTTTDDLAADAGATGCACRAGSDPHAPRGATWLALVVLATARRRRRRRRPPRPRDHHPWSRPRRPPYPG